MDTQVVLSEDELKVMKEFIEIDSEAKSLDKKKKELSSKVKDIMGKHSTSSLDIEDKHFSITESERRTIKKGMKDSFIATLVGMGKKSLVNYSIEPDMDSIFAEVDAGTLDKKIVNDFVTVTSVKTLNCK